jgi:hypothetical protein
MHNGICGLGRRCQILLHTISNIRYICIHIVLLRNTMELAGLGGDVKYFKSTLEGQHHLPTNLGFSLALTGSLGLLQVFCVCVCVCVWVGVGVGVGVYVCVCVCVCVLNPRV